MYIFKVMNACTHGRRRERYIWPIFTRWLFCRIGYHIADSNVAVDECTDIFHLRLNVYKDLQISRIYVDWFRAGMRWSYFCLHIYLLSQTKWRHTHISRKWVIASNLCALSVDMPKHTITIASTVDYKLAAHSNLLPPATLLALVLWHLGLV